MGSHATFGTIADRTSSSGLNEQRDTPNILMEPTNNLDSKPLRWYQIPAADPPFRLAMKYSHDEDVGPSSAVAIFPWSKDSLDTLWDGNLNTNEFIPSWQAMISQWSGACAVGGPGGLVIYGLPRLPKLISIKLPENNTHVGSLAWAMTQTQPFEPLLVFSADRLIHIFNVMTRKIIGSLRGHGGLITSIVVHPIHPYLFCTTSRDFTTRIYDLLLTPMQAPNNPHWPPGTKPSLAGAAHGLHMTEPEGTGCGRCVAVLSGGRSGGHLAAVLGAAFHLAQPLLATCGVDRTVKIWRLPPLEGDTLAREDKPLFSSTQIHKARVLSVTWISQDILITHSAPAMMRQPKDNTDDIEGIYEEAGTLVLWRWLSFDRFFPPNMPYQKVLRGCASDYQESASFKLISIYSLPMGTTNLHVYHSLTHDPIVLFPFADTIRMLNVKHCSPRFLSGAPPFPLDEDDMVESMKRARLNDDDDDEDNRPALASLPVSLVPVEWEIKASGDPVEGAVGRSEDMMVCNMGVGGGVIVSAGAKGSVWIWKGSGPP